MQSNRYQELMANGKPHPLKNVSEEVLDAARNELKYIIDDSYMRSTTDDNIDSEADAIVLAIIEAGFVIVAKENWDTIIHELESPWL